MKQQPTRQAIQSSLRSLLMAKPLDKITVRDIVEDCNVTRNTFYYYYSDIYDLFDDYLDTQTALVLEALPPDAPWTQALQRTLRIVMETPQMGRHVFLSKKQDTMQQYLYRTVDLTLERFIQNTLPDVSSSASDRRLVCAAIAHAINGLLQQWLVGPDAALLENNLHRLLQLFEGSIREALLRSGEEEL